jgi:hypothetical protein
MLCMTFCRQTLGERDEVPKVGPRAKGAGYSGDDCDPCVWIGIEPPPSRRQFGKVKEVKRIPPLRTIDDNTDDMGVVEFVEYRHPTSMQACRAPLPALPEPRSFVYRAQLAGLLAIRMSDGQ